MGNVYIRRKKKFAFFYSRRRRRVGTQDPSLSPCKDIPSLGEEVQNSGFFSNANLGISFNQGLHLPYTPETNQENVEVKIESNSTLTTIEAESDVFLITIESLPEDAQVPNHDKISITSGLVNNEPLLAVLQELKSTSSIPRRPRSTRKLTSLASRNWRTFKYISSDISQRKGSYLSASTSVFCEVVPKTPKKEDKMSKFIRMGSLSDVNGLLSTGVFEGAPVKYKSDNVELIGGILTTSGIYCGCSLCNFKKVVSTSKFEKHAGSISKNHNAHIFLKNGLSLDALLKDLRNVSPRSLGKVIAVKFGHQPNMEDYEAWEGNARLDHNKGESTIQSHFPDLLDELQASLVFPKGPRSTRTAKPRLHSTSEINQNLCSKLSLYEVNLQHPPAHKKRGIDVVSTREELFLKDSFEITSLDRSQSNIGEVNSLHLKDLNIENNEAYMSRQYTPDCPLSTVNCLLSTGLLEGVMVNYKKNEIDLCGFIKDLGFCCGCSSCNYGKVLSSFGFGKHGGDTSRNPNDYIFVNGKITLCSLVRELGKVSLGLLSGDVIQKMIGCQPNILCFRNWKDSFQGKRSNLQRISSDDEENQLAHVSLHIQSSPAERLRVPASEDNLALTSEDHVRINLQGQAEKTLKHREMDFHQQIFDLLDDGSKLSYRSHGKVVLIGYKFGKNILCSCCNVMFSASKFEAHAGFEKRRKPYHSLYTSYGKSLNQIATFLSVKSPFEASNKDLIMTYKAGEDLTLNTSFPRGEQFPSRPSNPFRFLSGRMLAPYNLGSCLFCRDNNATLNFGNICESTLLFCGQCGRMFHIGCLRHHGISDIVERPSPSDIWLCGNKCRKIRADLLEFGQAGSRTISESLLNSLRCFSEKSTLSETKFDVHWQLLSGRYLGGKSKSLLEQATQKFQEEFGGVYKGNRNVLSTMVNGEKGVAEFLEGIFCAVLTVKSVIMSAALLRVFDNHVAELPLAVTPKKRREGFFKILLFKIEEMLSLMKVENLILAADDHSLSMWVEKFGFTKLSINQVQEYQMNHRILMFENTTMLQKAISSTAV